MHPARQQKEIGRRKAASEILSCLISLRTKRAGYLQYLPHPFSLSLSVSLFPPSLSYLNAFRGEKKKIPLLIPVFQSSHASMCWLALSAPPCARSPQLYPHEEYVITGESRPDRWLCVKPQCRPGRVILTRGHYQINNPLFCVWASPKSPTGLLLPLSLYAFLPLFLSFPLVSQTCQVTCHCPAGYKVLSPLQEKDGDRRREVKNLWRKGQMKV